MVMANFDWALSQISKLLPLDEDSLKQILEHCLTLAPEAAAENFKNLLGDSPQALEFISSFNSRREASSVLSSSTHVSSTSEVSGHKRYAKKKKPPRHKLPPPRLPEDYGNTEGAYHKKDNADDYMPSSYSRKDMTTGPFALSSTPAARQLPTTSNTLDPSLPNVHSRTASPSKSTRTSTTTTPPRSSTSMARARNSSPKPLKSAKVTIQGGASMHGASSTLSDLESAIRSLEMSTNPMLPSTDPTIRRCSCMGTLHPLLTAAPNCLYCGKVVCAKEGLAPCTFCGAPLLKPDQVQEMIRTLREERGREKMAANNASQKRADVSSTPRPFQNSIAGNSEMLEKAKAHRDRLLEFQASNAARTTVVDEAASYETPDIGLSQWSSVEQRALQLRRQQKVLRDLEWNTRPEYEKRRVVVSVDLVGGKIVKRMADIEKTQELDADEETLARQVVDYPGGSVASLENRGTDELGGAFSRNPLLGGQLIRPIWKADIEMTDDALGQGNKSLRKQNRLWRKVQDDMDESEEYILNGGACSGRGIDAFPVEVPASAYVSPGL